MQKIEAQFEIVTPLFMGGANKTDLPEIRPPSIKGALRFWWRALQWGVCLKQSANDSEQALHTLHLQESELFGAAVNDEKGGQGKLLLKLKNAPFKQAPAPTPSTGQSYLLGQGLYHFRNGFLRQALDKKQTFTVILLLDNQVDIKPLINTLLLFGLLGGLGSRARKGWGSIAIRSLTVHDKNKSTQKTPIPDNKDDYINILQQILVDLPDASPPFSAFSKQTRIDLSLTGNESNALLNLIGNEMLTYRSYGRDGLLEIKKEGKKIPAERNFSDDHDLIWNFANAEAEDKHPRRVIFGLPHNYFYSDGTKVDVDAEKSNRRASPLVIHIHQFPSGKCIAIQSLLKARFLPHDDKIQLKKGRKTKMIECQEDWSVMTNYLDRFKDASHIIGDLPR